MRLHRNAKLGLAGRFALVQAREQGLSMREVAGRFSVSPATVCRWHRRWRRASEDERSTLVCLLDRSSRPEHMPRLLPASAQRRICAARRRTGWGPRLLTVQDRPSALDDLEGAATARALPPAPGCAGARPPLRVALSRRSAAHGLDQLRALHASRPRPHRGSQLERRREAEAARLRVRARDHRRPLAARLRRTRSTTSEPRR